MQKAAMKRFAVWARNELLASCVKQAELMGFSETGIKEAAPQSGNAAFFHGEKAALIRQIHQRAETAGWQAAFWERMEKEAYYCFIRLVLLRFMEVNSYLPNPIRIFSLVSGRKAGLALEELAYQAGLDWNKEEKKKVFQFQAMDPVDGLFRIAFLKQCNALHQIFPKLFDSLEAASVLLPELSTSEPNGVIYRLVYDIPEEDFQDNVETIGWLYQYYHQQQKDRIIYKNKGCIKKEDIPAATQLFTPHWIVRYMVDNSLGRYWVERNPDSPLRRRLQYLATPKTQEMHCYNEPIVPEDVTFFDPCMGSGNVLAYAFDVFMEIYRGRGYTDQESAVSIIEKNLYGIDIDDKVCQLAYFSVMMKARQYDEGIFTKKIYCNLLAVQESNDLTFTDGETYSLEEKQWNTISSYIIEAFQDGKEYGSLAYLKPFDEAAFLAYLERKKGALPLKQWEQLYALAKQAAIIAGKYTIVCTNPPYLNKPNERLKAFLSAHYREYGGDLFSAFIYRNFSYCKKDGYTAFMTPFVWMFIKSYEHLRSYMIKNKTIVTLMQLAYSSYDDATVPVCSFVLKNYSSGEKGLYINLSSFKGGMETQRRKALEAIRQKESGSFYETAADRFLKIPGYPIAYWANEKMCNAFQEKMLADYAACCTGMQTGNNDKYIRAWHEVNYRDTNIVNPVGKFKQYNCGGDSRKWYGNHWNVVLWGENGAEIRQEKGAVIRNERYFNQQGITWKRIGSTDFSFRYLPEGFIFDQSGDAMFLYQEEMLLYFLALVNSKAALFIFSFLAPTLNLTAGNMKKLPVIYMPNETIDSLVRENIAYAKADWDAFEISWDFLKHPLVEKGCKRAAEAYSLWEAQCKRRFNQMKANEETLNQIFIDMYGIGGEITPEAECLAVRKADEERDVKGLLSYAIGCMLGRYSLDAEGIIFAGGLWDGSKYGRFQPAPDNILLITEPDSHFENGVIQLLCKWLAVVYGAETVEENLSFIAGALGNKGVSPRDTIYKYFMKEFFQDHCKMYRKKPIYWLFDSGRQAGFQALIYMHRYHENTIKNLRTVYLHRIMELYEKEAKSRLKSNTKGERGASTLKASNKRRKQIRECREYEEKLSYLEAAGRKIDLDNGVYANYQLVQTGMDGRVYSVLANI